MRLGLAVGASPSNLLYYTTLIYWKASFYLVYGRDACLPTALHFNTSKVEYPIVATAYAQELLKKLQKARAIAKDNIQKAKKDQKKHYDYKSKECELQVGHSATLKVQPHFKLYYSYERLFTVESLTATNAVIKSQFCGTMKCLLPMSVYWNGTSKTLGWTYQQTAVL